MTREVRTPICDTPAVELGNRIWWKHVLPADRKIMYEGREIDFNEAYCQAGADAFTRLAHDTQPFVLAGETNSHTMAAQAGDHGEVLAAKVDMAAVHPETGAPAPGLYYALKLDEDADRIVRNNPKFGVSLRMKENWTRSDGEHFAVAPQHALGTWDPVLNGLSPWQPYAGQAGDLDLSNSPGTAVIDLSGLTFEPTVKEGADVTAPSETTSDTQIPAWFQGLVDSGAITVNDPAALGGEEGGDSGNLDVTAEQIEQMSDDQFDAWWSESGLGELDDPGEGDGETEGGDEQTEDDPGDGNESQQPTEPTGQPTGEVQASNQGGSVDLANSDANVVELAAVKQQNIELSRRVNASEYVAERDRMARSLGIPPAWIDTVRPLLEGTDDAVQLSNGDPNPGHHVRALLKQVGEGLRVLDLSESQGNLLLPTETEEQEKATARATRGKQVADMIAGT